jgi:hypothetical protein
LCKEKSKIDANKTTRLVFEDFSIHQKRKEEQIMWENSREMGIAMVNMSTSQEMTSCGMTQNCENTDSACEIKWYAPVKEIYGLQIWRSRKQGDKKVKTWKLTFDKMFTNQKLWAEGCDVKGYGPSFTYLYSLVI